MKRVGIALRILLCLLGLLMGLLMLAGTALGFYVFFDWRLAFIVVPVGAAAALLVAGAVSWWSEHR